MPETVRVAVAISTQEGVWVVPREGEDGELDAELLVAHADPTRDPDERERVALELVHERFSRHVSDFDLHAVSYLAMTAGDVDEVAVFCVFSDVLKRPFDATLELVDADEIPRLTRRTSDPAAAIALQAVELHGRRGGPHSPFSPRVAPPDRAQALALLHEQPTVDGERWSTTFSCEATGGGRRLRGPTAATAPEALGWGRAHADTVLLFVGERPGRPYNAGTELVDDPAMREPWPNVPDLGDLEPRPMRPEHLVRYVPLHPREDGPGSA